MEWAGDTLRFAASLDDMRLIYRVLHANLVQNVELLDCAFLHELQVALQEAAKRDGVDLTDHGAWDAWLGNVDAPTCEERLARRENIQE